jgi:DNA-binding NarL/FixJ family response regulator
MPHVEFKFSSARVTHRAVGADVDSGGIVRQAAGLAAVGNHCRMAGENMAYLAGTVRSDAIWAEFIRPEPKVIRLLLIEDHQLVREGICALLSLETDMVMVGDAGDIDTGIELVRRHQPDLVLCDLNMPGASGGFAARKLCAEFKNQRVLILTADDSLECMRQSFVAGAVGYVLKAAMRADLLGVIRRIAGGGLATCRGVADMVTREWLLGGAATPAEHLPLDPIDQKILRLIALGVPTRRIAADLHRGAKVVGRHRAVLLRRLRLPNTAAVARYAMRCNLLSGADIEQLFPSLTNAHDGLSAKAR